MARNNVLDFAIQKTRDLIAATSDPVLAAVYRHGVNCGAHAAKTGKEREQFAQLLIKMSSTSDSDVSRAYKTMFENMVKYHESDPPGHGSYLFDDKQIGHFLTTTTNGIMEMAKMVSVPSVPTPVTDDPSPVTLDNIRELAADDPDGPSSDKDMATETTGDRFPNLEVD